MLRTFLFSKIHRATVTQAEIDYEGSLTLDPLLLKAANLEVHEKVLVVNLNNGQRFETYIIEGEFGSGTVCLNGPAARLGLVGDKIIIMSFTQLSDSERTGFQPKIVQVDENNQILP